MQMAWTGITPVYLSSMSGKGVGLSVVSGQQVFITTSRHALQSSSIEACCLL